MLCKVTVILFITQMNVAFFISLCNVPVFVSGIGSRIPIILCRIF